MQKPGARLHRTAALAGGWLAAWSIVASLGGAELKRLPPIEPADAVLQTSHEALAEPLAEPLDFAEWEDCESCESGRTCQFFPDGLIYRSYMAGVKEPRFASVWADEGDQGPVWDVALGGRVGFWRWGTNDDNRPEGWQVDFEGCCFPRLDPVGESTPLLACDYRFGLPLTYADGPVHFKLGYYHLSSHLGDEYLLANPGVLRSNYSRDVLIFGVGYYWTDDLRLYAETGWADWADSRGGVSEPWEFQFGADFSPARDWRPSGSPFAAWNAHLREEANFGGNVVLQTGWQFPRGESGAIGRVGLEYYNGKSMQASFFQEHESKLGVGFWYDY